MIKAIVFDLGGVVFKSDTGSFETREVLAEELNIEADKLHNFWFKRKEAMITGKMSEDRYFTDLIRELHLKISLEEIKKLIRSYNIIDENMENIIYSLKKKYSIFALTNDVAEWVDFRIKNFKLNDSFNFIISSSDLGLAKPDPKIYEYLVKRLNLNPEEIIFIDNRIENIEPALKLGIKAFHFTTSDNLSNWLEKERVL